jgi:hypothetical protein
MPLLSAGFTMASEANAINQMPASTTITAAVACIDIIIACKSPIVLSTMRVEVLRIVVGLI